MPQLSPDRAKVVEEAESTGGVMEPGVYTAILSEVKAGSGEKGPYWTWVFKNPEDAPKYANWNHWLNTSLSEASAWKLKEVFAAFGVGTDTNTDALIGKPVRLRVGLRTVQKGKRAGDETNTVEEVLPVVATSEPDDETPF